MNLNAEADFSRYYSRIAALVMYAVNVGEGDKITLYYEPNKRDLALSVIDEAYARGAVYVHSEIMDYTEQAIRIRHLRDGHTPWFPDFFLQSYQEMSSPEWKRIVLYSNEDSCLLGSLDGDKRLQYINARKDARKPYVLAQFKGIFPWTMVSIPEISTARKAFPDVDPQQALVLYWEKVAEIMGLNIEDPVSYWRGVEGKIRARVSTLQEMNISSLRFQGEGTDLTVGIPVETLWQGYSEETADGIPFVANLPTFEIFTSPDFRKTEGRVKLTRPLVTKDGLGGPVREGWFEFHAGKVVDYGAREGLETLDAFFSMDERHRYLGEVALVGEDTPIAQSGITFYNTLFDENASCHLALGRSYNWTIQGGAEKNDDDLLAAGLNIAKSHEDMMVGNGSMTVTARCRNGSDVVIMENGLFTI